MKKLVFFVISLAAAAPPAAAQVGAGGVTISGRATATTDYRYRGVSQSDGDPALQGSVTIDHVSGLYGGLFVSTLTDNPRPGQLELSGYAGYTREIIPATNIDVGVQLYTFPDNDSASDATYFEPYAALRHTLGPVTAEAGAAYAPRQDAFGGDDSLYLYGDISAGLIILPVTVTARVGHTSGPARFTGFSDFTDWRIGAEYKSGPATFMLEYVDTDLSNAPNADGTVVASLRFGF